MHIGHAGVPGAVQGAAVVQRVAQADLISLGAGPGIEGYFEGFESNW